MFDLKKFAEDAKLSQTEIGNIIGVDQSVVSNMMSGKRYIRPHHIEKLRERYGEVVSGYINENIIRPATMTPYPQQESSQQILNDVVTNVTSEDVVTELPLVPDAIIRRPDTDVFEWTKSEEAGLPSHIFDITDILKRTKFVIKTDDDSMAPTLFQNEYVFMKPMPDNGRIIDGKSYGIDTKPAGLIIRTLYDKGDSYLAVPINRQYGELLIDKDEVIRIYHIIFHGSTRVSQLPDCSASNAERDKQINQQGEQISSLISQLDKSGERVDKLIEMIADKK